MGGQHLTPGRRLRLDTDGKLLGGRLRRWHLRFGDAHFYGSMGGQHLNAGRRHRVHPSATATGKWHPTRVFAFGDAAPHGNTVGIHLNSPIVALPRRPTHRVLAGRRDGGVFAEGSATFYGSMAGKPSTGRSSASWRRRTARLLAGRRRRRRLRLRRRRVLLRPALPVSGARSSASDSRLPNCGTRPGSCAKPWSAAPWAPPGTSEATGW